MVIRQFTITIREPYTVNLNIQTIHTLVWIIPGGIMLLFTFIGLLLRYAAIIHKFFRKGIKEKNSQDKKYQDI